jgi:hypothetical protein
MIKISFLKFCEKINPYLNEKLTLETVCNTYTNLLAMMDLYIMKGKLKGKVEVNKRVLKEAVLNFYVDTARLKSIHNINELSVEKDDAYKAYWLLRRKAIQVIVQNESHEFINEKFVTHFLFGVIKGYMKVDGKKVKDRQTWDKFWKLLCRTLIFRSISAQALELMILAFFCGCDFDVINTTQKNTL